MAEDKLFVEATEEDVPSTTVHLWLFTRSAA